MQGIHDHATWLLALIVIVVVLGASIILYRIWINRLIATKLGAFVPSHFDPHGFSRLWTKKAVLAKEKELHGKAIRAIIGSEPEETMEYHVYKVYFQSEVDSHDDCVKLIARLLLVLQLYSKVTFECFERMCRGTGVRPEHFWEFFHEAMLDKLTKKRQKVCAGPDLSCLCLVDWLDVGSGAKLKPLVTLYLKKLPKVDAAVVEAALETICNLIRAGVFDKYPLLGGDTIRWMALRSGLKAPAGGSQQPVAASTT